MAKAFNRLKKQVGDRKTHERAPSFHTRMRSIEVMLYELNAYILRIIHSDPEEMTEPDKLFAEATVDFNKHLEEVLKEDKRG